MALFAVLATNGSAAAATLTVTTEDDEGGADGNTGACSLREAIQALNAGVPGAGCTNSSGNGFGTDDRIVFDIDAADMANAPVARITPAPRLPNLTVPMTIDGYSQDGAEENTNAANTGNASNRGLNTVIRVEIDGSAQPNGPILQIRGGNTTITGLAIYAGPADGIRIQNLGENSIVGNFIGTDASGGGSGNASDGLVVDGGENVIGGTTAASRNLISNNGQQGVRIVSDDNTIQGNLIGTTVNGKGAKANGRQGILVSFGYDTLIGGEESDARNVISGNRLDGIMVKDCACATSNTTIANNYIGVDVSGLAALPNGQSGIQVSFEPINTAIILNVISGNGIDGIFLDAPGPLTFIADNKIGVGSNGTTAVGNGRHGINLLGTVLVVIGGLYDDVGNIIAHNAGNGISACSCSNLNFVIGNSIHSNGGLAIDLDNDGVTPNDDRDLDGDSGANGLPNFPVITEAALQGGNARVAGTLDSEPNTDFLVQVYANTSCDPSNFGEARTFLGTIVVKTNASGLATFDSELPGAGSGSVITATSTALPDGIFSMLRSLKTSNVQRSMNASGVKRALDALPSVGTSEVSRCFATTVHDDSVNNPNSPNNADDPTRKHTHETKDVKETDEQRQQRERTNTSGLDDYRTEGNVVGLCAEDESPACVYIANRDGRVKVVLYGEAAQAAKSIKVGDYLEADGEKIHELLFEATDVTVRKGANR